MASEQPASPSPRLEDAVGRVIDQVVKVLLPEGASGSGLYLPGDRVLTCYHVVDGAPGIAVRFRTGEQVTADVAALDATRDLALLVLRSAPQSLEPDRLDACRFDEVTFSPGQPLAAIGHPLGLDWAVTGGHFNGLRRPGDEALERFGIDVEAPLVQVDVAINPGNSGGPLIDEDGRLVGIASSVINPAFASNIGFAIAAAVAYEFWQANKAVDVMLIPYTCGHHHKAQLEFCPHTGKPAQPAVAVTIYDSSMVAYSCGHHHRPDLEYCPDTGKPIEPIDVPVILLGAPEEAQPLTCSNCGTSYLSNLDFCPHCGKPRSAG